MIRKGKDSDETFSIVLVGTKFLTSGLSYKSLIEKEVFASDFMNNSNIEVLTPLQLMMSSDWLQLDITEDRVSFTTSDASQKYPLRDYISNLVSLFDLGPKIKQIGFNYTRRIYCENEAEWHRVGHSIMPKTIWDTLLNDDSIKFGLNKYEVKSNKRTDDLPGYLLFRVLPMEDLSLELMVNEHIDYNKTEKGDDLLDEVFNISWEKSCKGLFAMTDEFERTI